MGDAFWRLVTTAKTPYAELASRPDTENANTDLPQSFYYTIFGAI